MTDYENGVLFFRILVVLIIFLILSSIFSYCYSLHVQECGLPGFKSQKIKEKTKTPREWQSEIIKLEDLTELPDEIKSYKLSLIVKRVLSIVPLNSSRYKDVNYIYNMALRVSLNIDNSAFNSADLRMIEQCLYERSANKFVTYLSLPLIPMYIPFSAINSVVEHTVYPIDLKSINDLFEFQTMHRLRDEEFESKTKIAVVNRIKRRKLNERNFEYFAELDDTFKCLGSRIDKDVEMKIETSELNIKRGKKEKILRTRYRSRRREK